MIEFRTWLPQIVGYCEFVIDDVGVRQAWVNHDFSKTSVTNFDELYEQIFDDLDGENFVANLHRYLPHSERMRNAIAGFFASLRGVDSSRNTLDILDSDQWQLVRTSALAVLEEQSKLPSMD